MFTPLGLLSFHGTTCRVCESRLWPRQVFTEVQAFAGLNTIKRKRDRWICLFLPTTTLQTPSIHRTASAGWASPMCNFAGGLLVSCKYCSLEGTRRGVVAISVFAFLLWATSGGSVEDCLRRGGLCATPQLCHSA